MIITLDGQRLDTPLAEPVLLRGIVDAVRRQHAGGRLVVSVAIDGRELTEDELSGALGQAVAPQSQVDLESADPRELASEALRMTSERLRGAATEATHVATRLNAGDVAGAMRDIGQLVQVWHAVQQTVAQSCGLFHVDLSHVNIGGRPALEALNDLGDRLKELRDALDARDFVLVADFIHYEFPPLCESWQTACDALATRFTSDKPR